jgi:hypothetical protein
MKKLLLIVGAVNFGLFAAELPTRGIYDLKGASEAAPLLKEIKPFAVINLGDGPTLVQKNASDDWVILGKIEPAKPLTVTLPQTTTLKPSATLVVATEQGDISGILATDGKKHPVSFALQRSFFRCAPHGHLATTSPEMREMTNKHKCVSWDVAKQGDVFAVAVLANLNGLEATHKKNK